MRLRPLILCCAGLASILVALMLAISRSHLPVGESLSAPLIPARVTAPGNSREPAASVVSPAQAALDARPLADLVAEFESIDLSNLLALGPKKFLCAQDLLAAIAANDPATAFHLIDKFMVHPALAMGILQHPLTLDRLLKNRDLAIGWVSGSRTNQPGITEALFLQIRKRLIAEPGQFGLIDRFEMTADQRRETVFLGLASVSQRDFNEALGMMERHVPEAEHQKLVGRLIANLAGDDPERAFEMVGKLGKYQSPAHYPAVFREWVKKDPELAMTRMRDLPPMALGIVLQSYEIIGNLVKRDPAATAGLIKLVPLTESNAPVFTQALDFLTRKDRTEAMSFINGLPPGGFQDRALAQWVKTVMLDDAGEGLKAIDSLPAAQQPAVRRAAVATLADTDFPEALGLAAEAPAEQQPALYRAIATATADHSPGNALALLADPVVSASIGPESRSELIERTASTWTRSDVDAASQWVAQLPEPEQARGVKGLIAAWMCQDPQRAMDWLGAQAPGPARDAGTEIVIDQLKDTDPAAAERWRKSLGN